MAPRSSLDANELADELSRLIPQARHLIWGLAAQELGRFGESVFSWQLLARVLSHRGANQSELARLTAQHPAGVCRSLEELEARGLVRRFRDKGDRRNVRVEATPAGGDWVHQIRPAVRLAVQEALEPLTRTEQRTLCKLLAKLVPLQPETRPSPEATEASAES
jgi:MarR family transcriptional regulator, organic hydroperoxide resistance regulator